MYYGMYPVDMDVSDFTAIAYQAEIILRLVAKPEIGWYARNMNELQTHNRLHGPHLIPLYTSSDKLDTTAVQG